METDNVIDSTNGKTELFYNNLKNKVGVQKNVTKFENEAHDTGCKCNCNFALPNCLRNCFGK